MVFGATLLPSSFEISREVIVEKPVRTVHASLSDLSQWSKWDPWQTRESGAGLKVLTQNESETKAVWLRDGQESGRITLKATTQETQLTIIIETPRVPQRTLLIQLQDLGGKTRVTWQVSGENGMYPLGNIFALQMEKYVGANYEDALKKLKQHLENKY